MLHKIVHSLPTQIYQSPPQFSLNYYHLYAIEQRLSHNCMKQVHVVHNSYQFCAMYCTCS